VTVHQHGGIGDASGLEVDFANEDIGFGVTGSQEEILFGASPELCVAMLFCDTLAPTEAIVIQGARRVALFTGYGASVRFEALVPPEARDWSERVLLAIDAVDYSYAEGETLQAQIKCEAMLREVRKANAAFSAIRGNKIIETGHWGCGAFAGHRHLKALIQLLAASLTDHPICFYAHGDVKFAEGFSECLEAMRAKHCKVSELWAIVKSMEVEVEAKGETDLFRFVTSKLTE